ncbi:MAG: hypothetical protein JXA69_04625 [Phycisphaerae bacterium]|nr:hypothetical protein [Phycisphaerae bacterium]
MDAMDTADTPPAGPPRKLLPAWLPITAIVAGLAVLIVVHGLDQIPGVRAIPTIGTFRGISPWILNLNACRGIAEALAASAARNEAAARQGFEPRPGIDPLNPYTWNLEPPTDPVINGAERAAFEVAAREIAFVEVGTVIWRRTLNVIASLMILAGAYGLARPPRRHGLLMAVAILMLVAATLTTVGMGLLIRHGGFAPRPVSHYVFVAAVGSAYAWLVLIRLWLPGRRRHNG